MTAGLHSGGRRTAKGLAIAATALLFVSLAFTATALYDRRERTLAAKQREIDNLSLVLASQAERVFESGELVLRSTLADIQGQPPLGGRTRPEVEQVLRARMAGIPPVRNITIVDKDGKIRASSAPGIEGDLSRNEGIRFIRDTATDGNYVYRLTKYPNAGTIIPVIRRITDRRGQYAGAIVLSLEPQYFQTLFESIARDAGDEIRLVRNDGAVLASAPGSLTPEPVIAGTAYSMPLRDHVPYARSERGTLDAPEGALQYSKAFLTRFPLYVDIRANQHVTLTSWRQQAVVIGVFVTLFAGMALLLTWRMYGEVGKRERAEGDADAQSRLFQSVFDTVPHPIFVKGLDSRYIAVNRAMGDTWRTTPEALIGKSLVGEDYRDSTEVERILAEDREILTQGRESTVHRDVTFPDGRIRKFHVIRRPLRDADGRITGLVGTAVDETDRLGAEAELQQSQHLLVAMFDTLPHNIWVKNTEGDFILVNSAMEAYFGVPRYQMLGRNFVGHDFRTSEERERTLLEDRKVLLEGYTINEQRWTINRRGDPVRVHLIKYPLQDTAGNIIGLIGASIDTTDSAKAESELEQSRALLQTVFDTLPNYVWVKDTERRIVLANQALSLYTDKPIQHVIGESFAAKDLLRPDEVQLIEEEDRRVLTAGEAIDVQRWTLRADGQQRLIQYVKRPIKAADGAVTGLVGIAFDLTDPVRAEQKVQESERLLATIIDTIPHHIWMKDRNGKLVHANKSLQAYVGKSVEELKGAKIVGADYRTTEENARIAEEDRRVLHLGESMEEVQWATSPQGPKRRFHVVKNPLYDATGAISGLVAISIDITALTRVEEALRESQALLQTVFDAVPLAVLVWSPERRLITANRAAATMWARAPEAMLGLGLPDLIPEPNELQEVLALDDLVMREDRILDHEHNVTLPGGRTVRMRAIKAPLHDAQGGVSGLLSICEDVTDEAQAAEALRSSQSLLKAIFDAIPLAMLVKDLEDRLMAVNPPMARRWGKLPADLVGTRIRDLEMPANERQKVEDTDAQVVREDRVLDYEIERTMPDGKKRRLRAIKVPLHGHDGTVNGILGMSEDITERHRMQEEKASLERQLEQVQKMDTVGRLAGGVAHDFNNLLTPVIGFADIAMARLKPDEPIRNELRMIREAAVRAAELTRGLLSFSRSQVMTLRPVNLNDEIQSLNRMLSRVIGEGIEIVLNLEPALDLVQADATQMHQVLMNLAVNARDAMPQGGKLVVESQNIRLDSGYAERILETAPGDYVMISVSDTGTGMNEETQRRIFEPFFTTKEVGKGTGLGLSIVYGIVRQHQGTIRVYSEPGKGTSFKMLLPRHSAGILPVTASQRPMEQLRGSERVLVVEDEQRVRDAVCALLGSLGYDVLQAGSPQEAVGLMTNGNVGRVQLLIADMMMPGQNGRELYAALKQRDPALNVLFMSGYPRHLLAEIAAAVGPDRFIGKPFGLQDLAEKVRAIIEMGAPG